MLLPLGAASKLTQNHSHLTFQPHLVYT